MNSFSRMAAGLIVALTLLADAGFAAAADKLLLGVALPRAQLGQGNGNNADVAEPVRQALLAYLKGPAIDVVALESRIPLQINAEARDKGCAYVLYTDVTQAHKGGGLSMLKKLAPMAAAVPLLGGGMSGQMAASMAAQTVMNAQMQSAQEDAMANAMAAINGAQKNNVRAGDSLTLSYRLAKPGEEPGKSDKFVGKAKANGDDVLTPLIESLATAVVQTVTAP